MGIHKPDPRTRTSARNRTIKARELITYTRKRVTSRLGSDLAGPRQKDKVTVVPEPLELIQKELIVGAGNAAITRRRRSAEQGPRYVKGPTGSYRFTANCV